MITIDIVPEGGYLVNMGNGGQPIPTLVGVMQTIIKTVRINTDHPEQIENLTNIRNLRAMEGLVENLNEYGLTFHQILSVMADVQTKRTRSLHNNTQSMQKQLQLIDVGCIIDGAVPNIEEAQPFILLDIMPEQLGNLNEYDYNGRVAVNMKGRRNEPLFLKKTIIPQLKSLTRKSLERAAGSLGDKGIILVNYIESLKDRDMGIYPTTHVNTRISSDGGEIDAEVLEAGGGTAGDDDEYTGEE